MKRWIWTALIAGVMLTPSAFADGRPGIRERQRNQQQRIAAGVASGRLTAREAVRLERREAALAREIRRDRIDGRGLTVNERRKIDRKHDRLSRQIYRGKHDGQRAR